MTVRLDLTAPILPRWYSTDESFGCGLCSWEQGEQIAQCQNCRAAALREIVREAVEEAYREGYNEGVGDGHPMSSANSNRAWARSDAYEFCRQATE